jgi:hypothetical protein
LESLGGRAADGVRGSSPGEALPRAPLPPLLLARLPGYRLAHDPGDQPRVILGLRPFQEAPRLYEDAAAAHPCALALETGGLLLLQPGESARVHGGSGRDAEIEDIGQARGRGVIRAGAMQGAARVDGAAAGGQGAGDGVAEIEPSTALQGVRAAVIIRGAMRQQRCAVGAGDKLHAAIGLAHILKRHPDADLLVIEIRVAESLVLMPRRLRTINGGLIERVIADELRLRPEELARNLEALTIKRRLAQTLLVIARHENLRELRRIRIVIRAGKVEVRPFIVPRPGVEEPLDDAADVNHIRLGGEVIHRHESPLAKLRQLPLAQQRRHPACGAVLRGIDYRNGGRHGGISLRGSQQPPRLERNPYLS